MKNNIRKLIPIYLCILLTGCGGGNSTPITPSPIEPIEPTEPVEENIEHLGGGTASVKITTADAFSQRSANVQSVDKIAKFNIGDDFFENPWVAGSSSTSSRDGLGGLFNNNACQNCHIRDGRGHAPAQGSNNFSSILFRAARSNISAAQTHDMQQAIITNVPDETVGGQLQQDAIANVQPEVELTVQYNYQNISFSDGFEVELRKPTWLFTNLYENDGYMFNDDTIFSARVAPPMTGLGLLALISENDIIANQDINDADTDGISGKANYVWSIEQNQITIGRFGWKAGQPSLIEQAAGAFVNDMGLTSRLHTEESCLSHQLDCQDTPNGNGDSVESYNYEVSDKILDAIAFYSSHLAVPQRRNAYAENVKRGKALFMNMNCQACHTESYTTQLDSDQPELSEQVIFPYTDLLLHNMGTDLADFTLNNQPAVEGVLYENLATAREWRTPPLWGLGLTKTVDPQATFLHDGRARTIMEAVLWHGGEAEQAKQAVLLLNAQQRSDLLAFLQDL